MQYLAIEGSPSIAARYNLKANRKKNTYDYTRVYPFANCRMPSLFFKGGKGDLFLNAHIISVLQINPPPDTIGRGREQYHNITTSQHQV